MNEAHRQIAQAGYLDYLSWIREFGETLEAFAVQAIFRELRKDARFREGLLFGLHTNVGRKLTDFRSYRGAFGRGSLQLVIDRETGKCYADVDGWNPYADLIGFVAHSGEVIGHWLRRRPAPAPGALEEEAGPWEPKRMIGEGLMPDIPGIPEQFAQALGVHMEPPPAQYIDRTLGVIGQAIAKLEPGERGKLVWIATTDGRELSVNLAIVNKFSDHFSVTGWIGKQGSWKEPFDAGLVAGIAGEIKW